MIEFYEILLFFRQFGLAAAGAASLWGVYLIFFARNHEVAEKLIWMFFPPFFVFVAVWFALAVNLCVFCTEAHEGISLGHQVADIKIVMREQFFIIIALFILSAIRLLTKLPSLSIFFGVQFFLISFLMLFPWGEHESFTHTIFTSIHNWHSVFTMGTVLTVDFLFTMLDYRFITLLKKIFPVMTKAIFFGLGLDFLSVALIFEEKFLITDKLLFTQTLVALIIINGCLLSGPVLRAALQFRKRMKTNVLSPGLNKIIGISGSISIIGWLSITALDGFRSLSLSYWQLFILYITLVACAYLTRGLLEKFRHSLLKT